MVSGSKIHITPRKGDYCLLDKEAGRHVSHTIFQLPGKLGKGVLVTPTVHGNLLVGPTAKDIEDKEATATTAPELAEVMEKSALSVKDIPFRLVITSFCGLRAHEDQDDFVIGEPEDAPGFFDAAGIESPGLTSAPAIGVYVAKLVAQKAEAKEKAEWNGRRKGIIRPEKLGKDERAALIRERPEYGTIICRCEGVSEGEIMDAVNRTLGAVSPRRNQAPGTPRNGTLPGWLLYAQDDGDIGPGETNEDGRDLQKQARLQYAGRKKVGGRNGQS